MFLKLLRENAEEFLNEAVTSATITVPASFDDAQRQATMDAGYVAGFERIELLNEPTAAALAYKHFHPYSIGQKLLIFNLGGGFLDVSIVDIQKDDINVLASNGDCYLGGADIDRVLVDYCLNKFQTQTGLCLRDVTTRNVSLLKREVEAATEELSFATEVEICVDDFYDKQDLILTLTRKELEVHSALFFQKCLHTVNEVMTSANVTGMEIDTVLLVGGSSRIPKVQEFMGSIFPGKVRSNFQPDHAIAFGAAVSCAHSHA
ncbi:hypothetical protein RCL1_005409 [Eukaryota sp. TZLM3-RCL]